MNWGILVNNVRKTLTLTGVDETNSTMITSGIKMLLRVPSSPKIEMKY
jgi:hypothetical protein